MQRCLYEEYEETFLRARGALLAGDAQALLQLRGAAQDREVSHAMATQLALTDARRGSPKRPKEQVCRDLGAFCSCLAAHRDVVASRRQARR